MRNQTKIKTIRALEILDSRGNPTLMCEVVLGNGVQAKACVPSGASTGKHEALELRDGDKKRFGGMGVMQACDNVNIKIVQLLKGKNVEAQKEIDEAMIKADGTDDKSNLGANAMLAVSLACVRAGAKSKKLELYRYLPLVFAGPGCKSKNVKISQKIPTPMLNIINGGKHSDSGLDIQEFMIVPRTLKFCEKLRQASEIYQNLKKVVSQAGYSGGVGDEGGFAPKLEENFQALEMVKRAIDVAGYKLGKDVDLALDCAASEFYNAQEKQYFLRRPQASLTFDRLISLYSEWKAKFPIVSFEDPLAEDDWLGWKKMTARNGKAIMLVGDDLFATNTKRLKRGVEEGIANAILIKPNQIGTLSETLDCIQAAHCAGYKIIISHRSGETCDTFAADLAVAVGADFVKFGAPARGERIAKYNRLLEIEGQLR
jgi:enolase